MIAPVGTNNAAVQPSELTLLAVFIAAGADPHRLARWICENTETPVSEATLGEIGRAVREHITGSVPDVLERGMPENSTPAADPPAAVV